MKVSGFTFIRNAIKYDYPVAEAIRSILPICDEVVVAVGKSDDDTLLLIKAIDPKVRVIETVWNDSLQEGGTVLADETNKAFKAVSSSSDWCFYIQGDEAIHEQYLPVVLAAMKQHKSDTHVDGLLFKYLHFYGSYDYVGNSGKWYRNEIRVIKNDPSIYSYRDAQGFRKGDNQKLQVKAVDAYIYHYGWVREPSAMQGKWNNFGRYWNGDNWTDAAEQTYMGEFDYSKVDSLERFTGSHPAVMQQRIKAMNWRFDRDLSYNKLKLKDRLKNLIEKLTGQRPFDYKNYKII
ncbi:glycosyltransferase family 2 protein [Segetibacter sp. 3557_3]|uniref:glycosyltransferase family 2 protein n=1 Tax=Segetibacter sp. 3557_3 TaxID=2547429 RepID=UPI00105911AD|nr:glycosyltransferase family 2 protein [Segetibacter sp. 3557_3]TDH23229.1 glycosyltransferase family 2 protein [Segetibacter sp. 3557_3]